MQALSIEIISVSLPPDSTLQLEASVPYRVEVRGNNEANDTPYRYNLYVSGNDIYGNRVFIQVAQGTLTVRGPRVALPPGATTPVNEPATTDRFEGTWTVPNDGTLHNITSGYRMIAAIYSTGTPLPMRIADLTANLAVPLQQSGLLKIDVPPDVAIPPVAPIFKQRATATASVSGGAVTLTVTNPGTGYDPTFPPSVTVAAPPSGTTARFLAIVEAETGSITGFTTLDPGSGYIAPPAVTIATSPSYMTQRTGGILYKAGNYYGGDIARFQATLLNRSVVAGRQGRPLRSSSADRHRINLVLTTDPEYDEAATPPDDDPDDDANANPTPTPTPTPAPPPAVTDDFLMAFHDIRGDMAGVTANAFSTIRAVSVYGTPGALPSYGLNTGGIRATATASIPVGGVLTTANLTVGNAGTSYDSANPPAVTISGGGGFGATAVAVMTNGVGPVNITSGGSGYTTAPTVTFTGGGGTGATATAVVTGGAVTAININSSGSGYTSAPTVTFTGGGGTGAAATASTAAVVASLNVINGGAGYVTAPTVTIAAPLVGARNYTPTPDNGFLDIGEQVQIDFEVLMPKNFAGIYYVAARADSLDNGNFLQVDPLLRKTWVSNREARITLLSGPDPRTQIVSQVTAPDGTGLIQSDGPSERSVVDGGGRYTAFQSLATDLAVPQAGAATSVEDFTGSGVPLLSSIPRNTQPAEDLVYRFIIDGPQQIYRRDLTTREIVVASVSSGGATANGPSQNPAINRAPGSLAVDGRYVAYESEANNLVANDINQASDIFVRSYTAALRTSRVSINEDGIQGNAGSFRPAISGNGRFIVFESTATNLDLVNPLPAVNNPGAQIYVHDRDVSGSGTYDTPGNVRTYLVSIANDGSTRATASVLASQIISGQVSAASVISGGSNYLAAYPPAVIIAPPPSVPGAVQATAEAVVNSAGQVTNIRILNPGAGYNPATPPTVTVAPRGRPAGDSTGNNGWNNQPRISDDGKFVTWVSYSSNLPRIINGPAVGNNGWRGVVYRIRLQDGIPLTDTLEAVSVNGSGVLANLLAYEPSINADGSVIAFSSWANNLVADDTNGAVDVFARDYRAGINATRRVSDSQRRLAIGTIFFQSGLLPGLAPNNNPATGDTITLNDGVNAVNFVFGPAPGGNVPIGATASATRNNLVRAINNAFRAGQLKIIAGNLPSDRLRSVNTGNNETILDATGLLNFTEPTSNTPANINPFSSAAPTPPGQALLPGLLLLHTDPDQVAPNQPITVTTAALPAQVLATDGVTTLYTMASGYVISTSGMRIGGTQGELDAGELDGVPLGSYQPSIDQSGNTVAYKSTMGSLDVFDRTFTDTNGLFRGELLRVLYNASGNIYVAERDPLTGITRKSTRVSVSRFGYRTTGLLNVPSTAASHSPSISGNGRYVTFSSDSNNRGGLIFGRTNLLPEDTNEVRDIFVHDRLIATDLPPVIENQRPQAVLTEPLWLSGRQVTTGSIVTFTVLATDGDQTLTNENVRFLVNGQEFSPTTSYGNYFSFSYTVLDENTSNTVYARVIDNSGAPNDSGISQPLTFASVSPIPAPTSVTLLEPDFLADPGNLSGTPTVGFFVRISARVTLPFLGSTSLYSGGLVRFYANGVLVGEQAVQGGASGQTVSIDWYPQFPGPVELTAVAVTYQNRFATADPLTWATLASNTWPSFTVVGVGTDAPPGSPEAIAVQLFQTVMSRSPSASEQTYYATQLATSAITPAQMVAQLVTTQEYTNLQNRLFDFYYRLGTSPLTYTYAALLGNIRSNPALLPPTTVDAGATNPPTPYGATEGQAVAAQQIVSSAGFNAAFPNVATLSDQSFVTWLIERMSLFGGQAHTWTTTPVSSTLMPGSAAPKGRAVAFITAYYAAKNTGGRYGLTSAYQYQLYASSLQWLFTGVWSAPATLQVTTLAQLNTFITNLLAANEGQPTWAWIDSFTSLSTSQRTAQATPAGDGINNLLKYAFNMSPLVAGGQLAVGGTSGTPRGDVISVNGLSYLQLTYIRRVNAPSISYNPEFNWALNPGSWTRTTASNPETVTPIGTDGVWERVTVRDIVPTSMANARFGRLVINASYWTPAQPNPAPDPSPNVP